MDPERIARFIDEELGTWYEAFDSTAAFQRQITGEKKWQVTVEWEDGTTSRVVID